MSSPENFSSIAVAEVAEVQCNNLEAAMVPPWVMKLYVSKISLHTRVPIRGVPECKPGSEEVEFSKAREGRGKFYFRGPLATRGISEDTLYV